MHKYHIIHRVIENVLCKFKQLKKLHNTKMISIYLDDLRTPIESPSKNTKWAVVRNFEEFIDLVEKTGLANIEIISLDHDLDFSATRHYVEEVKETYIIDYSKIKEKTGLDAARWLIEYSKSTGHSLPQCYTHSANPIGSGHIMGYLNLYLKLCKRPENCIRVRWDYEINEKIFRK